MTTAQTTGSGSLPETIEAADATQQRRTDAVRAAAAVVADWITFQGARLGVPGIQAAIRYRGELVLDLAWGVADAETGEPLSSDHLFRIASHSKTFTATAALQLVERGALSLSDTVAQHLPDFTDTSIADATVRELLGHQAGVIRDGGDADYWQRGGPFPDREMLRQMCLDEGRVFDRNEFFKYSNIGFGLLGLIIEAASGLAYAEYVQTAIVDALGLTSTGPEWVAARADQYAAGHTGRIESTDIRRRIEHVDTRALAAATGWYSTAVELSAYLDAHRPGDERLVNDVSKRLLRRRESQVDIGGGAIRHYGLGFELRELAGRDLVGHSGGYPGHITRTWLDINSELVVSVLTNAIDGPADALATGAIGILALALEHADADPVDIPVPVGRYASLWSVLDIVRLGSAAFAMYPASPDPATQAERLLPVDGCLTYVSKDGFASAGEPVTATRDAEGRVTSIVSGGVTMWPIEQYRRALAEPDPSLMLAKMSL